MKYLKWLNLIPLVMFIAMDVFLEAKIYPIRMVAVAVLVVLNVVTNKSMKGYLKALAGFFVVL